MLTLGKAIMYTICTFKSIFLILSSPCDLWTWHLFHYHFVNKILYYEERLNVDLCKNILYIENSEQLSMFTNTTSNHDLLKLLILFFLLPNKSTLAYLECDDGTGDDSCQSSAGLLTNLKKLLMLGSMNLTYILNPFKRM